jgi:hypothetical protein
MVLTMFALTLSPAMGQNNITVEPTWHRGYLVAHRPLVEGLRKDRVNGFDLSIGRQVSGKKSWHWDYGLPKAGIYFGAWNLGNNDYLGNAYSLVPYVDFKVHQWQGVRLGMKFGWGIGVAEKKFDAETNYKNVAIGSRVNNSILLHPTLGFSIAKKHEIKLGLSLTHYSNGSFETPNLGVNMASFTLGYAFNKSTEPLPTRTEMDAVEKGVNDFVFGSFFVKEVAPADGAKYGVASLFAERMWRTSNKFSFGGGIDLFYDKSLSQRFNYDESNGFLELIRSGIHAGTEMHLGNTALVLSIGSYVYSGVKSESVYHRFGIRQNINPNWTAGIHVKSHWGKADFMEIGIGRKFTKANHKKQHVPGN